MSAAKDRCPSTSTLHVSPGEIGNDVVNVPELISSPVVERFRARLPGYGRGELGKTKRGAAKRVPPRTFLCELPVFQQAGREPRQPIDQHRNVRGG